MKVVVVRIRPESELSNLVRMMRTAAKQEYVREAGLPSRTVAQAFENARPQVEQVLSNGKTRILQFTERPDELVSVVLTIDAMPGEPMCWHLSMGVAPKASGEAPGRVPTSIARRLAASFETTTEGPPEGVFRMVRHFRAPYRPE